MFSKRVFVLFVYGYSVFQSQDTTLPVGKYLCVLTNVRTYKSENRNLSKTYMEFIRTQYNICEFIIFIRYSLFILIRDGNFKYPCTPEGMSLSLTMEPS